MSPQQRGLVLGPRRPCARSARQRQSLLLAPCVQAAGIAAAWPPSPSQGRSLPRDCHVPQLYPTLPTHPPAS